MGAAGAAGAGRHPEPSVARRPPPPAHVTFPATHVHRSHSPRCPQRWACGSHNTDRGINLGCGPDSPTARPPRGTGGLAQREGWGPGPHLQLRGQGLGAGGSGLHCGHSSCSVT